VLDAQGLSHRCQRFLRVSDDAVAVNVHVRLWTCVGVGWRMRYAGLSAGRMCSGPSSSTSCPFRGPCTRFRALLPPQVPAPAVTTLSEPVWAHEFRNT
jgi:hypothetical protein